MKKFEFRLQTYVKLKEVKRYQVMNILASIQRDVERHVRQIEIDTYDIYHVETELELDLGAKSQNAGQMKHIPEHIEKKRANINLLKLSLEKLIVKREEVQVSLATVENEIKVLEKMKVEQLAEFTRNRNRKESADMEELISIRSMYNNEEEDL